MNSRNPVAGTCQLQVGDVLTGEGIWLEEEVFFRAAKKLPAKLSSCNTLILNN